MLRVCLKGNCVFDVYPVEKEKKKPKKQKTQRHSWVQDHYPPSEREKTDGCTEGIVTRCRRGNTWSIPCCRNVFISLFTNVAISRCVHYKVHCRLDHSIKRERGFNGEPVPRPGWCYLNSWHSLVRHVRVCTDLRLLYHTEGKKYAAFGG